ncbi:MULTISPECIES: STAS domain-containing protein [Streptomyces]|uniref:Anti-sigma factor antagonist n=2 Tax=Streptomyces TaxID=1883 RepID=A0A124ED67_9ACTN|nr:MULTISPECIES: STAS domain-containing protein [Streptomyces]KUH39813.1 hypothetical protein ATE80_05645 [Streptomyces kanasensis]UUS34472.1 STAS domain-containing protein [Streptomyces changanensis]
MNGDPRVTVREAADHAAVVTVAGALDLHTADAFHARAAAAMATHRHLVLDLTHLTFCDSSGLSTLLRLLRHARTADAGLALAAVPAQMRRLLAITGADTVFALYDSPAAALAAHHRTARP